MSCDTCQAFSQLTRPPPPPLMRPLSLERVIVVRQSPRQFYLKFTVQSVGIGYCDSFALAIFHLNII